MTTGSSLTVSRQMEQRNLLSLFIGFDFAVVGGFSSVEGFAGILRSRSESWLMEEVDMRGWRSFSSDSDSSGMSRIQQKRCWCFFCDKYCAPLHDIHLKIIAFSDQTQR